MMTDPIADMLTRIKNASRVGKTAVVVPYSKIKEAVAKILSEEGYVGTVKVEGEGVSKAVRIELKYENTQPVITEIRRMSRPGLRRYVKKHTIPRVVGGMGISIVSTPKGIMTGTKAQKLGIGGELICEVW